MKAVKESDFEKYGCVNCGCEFCYAPHIFYGSVAEVICAECDTKFIVMHDSIKVSPVGFGKKNYTGYTINQEKAEKLTDITEVLSMINFSDEKVREKLANGIAFEKDDSWIYPIVGPHPREGINKHKLIVPDIRPEDGVGDYCFPRGVGYDLACFVKSKEAGERITNMINRVNKDYDNHGFSCHLDYREMEPLWIQVKIDYTNKYRARYLQSLIEDNDCIITEDLVYLAMNQDMDFLEETFCEEKQYQIKKIVKKK